MIDRSVSDALREFVTERDWAQFHTPANLAKSIVIEAAELLECFQWGDSAPPEQLSSELADVLTYCYLLANTLALDMNQIVLDKLELTRAKYPTEKARGRSTKYDQLPD